MRGTENHLVLSWWEMSVVFSKFYKHPGIIVQDAFSPVKSSCWDIPVELFYVELFYRRKYFH